MIELKGNVKPQQFFADLGKGNGVEKIWLLKVEGTVYFSTIKSGTYKTRTQFKPLPQSAEKKIGLTESDVHKILNPGLRKLVWCYLSWDDDVLQLERAVDGTYWKDGFQKYPTKTFKNKREAKRYALNEINKDAEREAKRLRQTRAKARKVKAL